MAELIHQFSRLTTDGDGTLYVARVYGERRRERWTAWIEFSPHGPDEKVLRVSATTDHPTRAALSSWASGLPSSEVRAQFLRARTQPSS